MRQREIIRQEMSAQYGCAAQLAGANAQFDACSVTAEANELQDCKAAAQALINQAQSGNCQKTWATYASGLMAMRSDYVLSGSELAAEEGTTWRPQCAYISNSPEERLVAPGKVLPPVDSAHSSAINSARPVIKKLIEGQMNIEGAGSINIQ